MVPACKVTLLPCLHDELDPPREGEYACARGQQQVQGRTTTLNMFEYIAQTAESMPDEAASIEDVTHTDQMLQLERTGAA